MRPIFVKGSEVFYRNDKNRYIIFPHFNRPYITIKGHFVSFYHSTPHNRHVRPFPPPNAQHRTVPFWYIFDPFLHGAKKSTHRQKTLQIVVGPCGAPYGVFESQCGCPYGVFSQLVASLLARLPRFRSHGSSLCSSLGFGLRTYQIRLAGTRHESKQIGVLDAHRSLFVDEES